MGLFSKPEVIVLKESSDARKYLSDLQELQNTIEPSSDLYKKIDREISIVKAGIIGEDNIMFELQHSGMNLVVLHDICIMDPDGNTAQIDYIVITQLKIVFIECKNLFGNIEINSKGDFIRTIEYAGRRYKEGIYSPITQNERHMLVYKNARSAEKGFFMRLGFEHWFDSNHKSLVVMANPKTVVNDRYAKKEVKNQVIRADQLISVLKNMKSDIKTSKKDMLDLGQSILSMNIEDRKDYIEKFRELKEEVDNSNQTTILDVDAINNNSKNDCTDDASIETTSYTDEPLKANDILPEFQDFNPNDMICPRCGHKLVLRTATKGANKGNQFWGCSNFPKCRYIANVN